MEESEHPSLGSEDGTIDVERLLVEPQDEHLSVDSVMCFNDKTPKTAVSTEDVSRSSGKSGTGIAQEGKDILSGEVLNAIPSDVEVGYLRLENDFCSMGEEYLLGVEFAESITNLDYGSSEGLHTSVSDNQVQVSTSGSDTACGSDNLREYHIDPFNVGNSKLSDAPLCHECETLSGENPTISPQNSVKSPNSWSSSFQDVLSDENDGRFSQDGNMFCSDAANSIKGREELTASVQASSTNVLPTQKRSRRPTQRYIESVQSISTYPKKRREISSTIKEKSPRAKDHKKFHMGPKAIKEPAEFSVVAIQVPFGSLAKKECSERHARDMATPVDDLKKHGVCRTDQKKLDDCSAEAQMKKRDGHATATNQLTRNDSAVAVIRKRRTARSPTHQKKRDDRLIGESSEGISGRRKHHRVWSISEVRKLIDGVTRYGVGRWSRIKKLFFSASAHRTSVDLKDKWRNLLKASGMQDNGSQLQLEKKRSMAWRPLPESILRRVCELAAEYPYPKGQRARIRRRSPDTSADTTLSDYRRILRSINAN